MKIISRRKTTARAFLSCSLLAACLCFTACDDFLTDEPESQLTTEQAYNSMDGIKRNALLSIYNYIGGSEKSQGLQGTDRGVYDLNSFTTDEQIVPIRGGDWYDGGLWGRLFYHTWGVGEAPFKDTWDYLYKVVMLCNKGIEHIDEFQTNNTGDQEKLRYYRAELQALRAMYYFYLMDLYGRVPLVTRSDVKSSELTLCDRQTLFYWIYNEFNEAMPNLYGEYSNRLNTEYYGRMTTFVAYFVMMKLALNAEIYTDNDWTDNVHPDGKDITLRTLNYFSNETFEGNAWETVRNIMYIIAPFYSLEDYFSDNFDVNNEGSKENIFTIPMNPLLYSNKYNYFYRSRHYCHGAALGGASENGPCATISTIETFGYNSDHEDARLGMSFYYDEIYVNSKTVYEDDGVTPLVYHPLDIIMFDLSGTRYEKTAGARLGKYSVDATARNDGRMGNNDIVLFRYGDAVLMYAEACYRLGDTEEALMAINQVYRRSNGKQAKGYTEVNDDVLLRERLLELMWEGWRRNDLIRFRRFHQTYDLKNDAGHEEDAHTTVFPIPADMIAMHPEWEQNPGY